MDFRAERVGRLIQEKIGELIVGGKVKDPRVNPFLSVTRVSVSRDFSWADVYVSSFKPERSLARSVEGLQSAAGFIQKSLASCLRMRQTPRLRFHEDAGLREGFELTRKIDALAGEGGGAEAAR
ncbi:MAG: ribosome-binding factor A [Treponematales bacterium]